MKSPRIPVSFDKMTMDNLKKIAEKRNISISALIREYVEQGMQAQVGADNIDLITKIIREQLQIILNPAVERICSLSAKTGVMAASSTFLTAETINKFVPESQQEEVKIVYEAARKKGIAYMKSKISD